MYLLSDASCWYSDTAVLNVHAVGTFDGRHVLDTDSTIVVVNHPRYYFIGRTSIDHVTCHTSGSCVRLV